MPAGETSAFALISSVAYKYILAPLLASLGALFIWFFKDRKAQNSRITEVEKDYSELKVKVDNMSEMYGRIEAKIDHAIEILSKQQSDMDRQFAVLDYIREQEKK